MDGRMTGLVSGSTTDQWKHSSIQRWLYVRDLLQTLVARNMKLRYKRSVMGFAWSLLNPLAQLLVFSFVFTTVLPLNIPNYTVFLFTGLLPWTWFSGGLVESTEAIVGNRELIRRPGFPTAVLPVITILSHLVHFLLALPVLLLFILAAKITLTWAILALPLVILVQFIFMLSLAYLLSTMHVTFRDTQYLLNILLLLGFYLTPVLYDSTDVPLKFHLIYSLNPMYHLINAYRAILLHGVWPDFVPLSLVATASFALLLVGYRYFLRTSSQFVEEL
jgi:homopolymeric O-antigen transport system permease protein